MKPITSTARAKELGSLGGKVRSVKKSISARIRELKKKGLTSDMERHIVQLLENPDIFDVDIILAVQSMKDKGVDDKGKPIPLSVEEKRMYAWAMMKLREIRHGRKDNRSPDVGVQVNVQQNKLTVEMKERMIRNLIGRGDCVDAVRESNSEENQ